MPNQPFDYNLANECARAYSVSTGLGCTVSDTAGTILFEHGNGCGSCKLCDAAGLPRENCIRAHNYGMTEAERFGGKYIYFCPLGLTCFVSPIIGDVGSTAKITVGPFLMVDIQDFIDCELIENLHLDDEHRQRVLRLLDNVPHMEPHKVQELSVLLFMSVGFMNNVSAENRLLEQDRSNLLQGQINAYIATLKNESAPHRYPFEKERSFLLAISQHNSAETKRLLQAYLAALFANDSTNPAWIRMKLEELAVMISRTSIEHGATEEQAQAFLDDCRKNLPLQKDFRTLSSWFFGTAMHFIDSLSAYPDAKHANTIHRCIQYISSRYAEHLTLEETAAVVSLSPDYLSRIFKQETGITFNQYLNNIRITKAKELIRHSELRLTDISQLVGYDDQSYFTKVFKRVTGLSPNEYKKRGKKKHEK